MPLVAGYFFFPAKHGSNFFFPGPYDPQRTDDEARHRHDAEIQHFIEHGWPVCRITHCRPRCHIYSSYNHNGSNPTRPDPITEALHRARTQLFIKRPFTKFHFGGGVLKAIIAGTPHGECHARFRNADGLYRTGPRAAGPPTHLRELRDRENRSRGGRYAELFHA